MHFVEIFLGMALCAIYARYKTQTLAHVYYVHCRNLLNKITQMRRYIILSVDNRYMNSQNSIQYATGLE